MASGLKGMEEGLMQAVSTGPIQTRNDLGTLNGCYIPCLLNILGAVLFLRVGFSIGVLNAFLCFALCLV